MVDQNVQVGRLIEGDDGGRNAQEQRQERTVPLIALLLCPALLLLPICGQVSEPTGLDGKIIWRVIANPHQLGQERGIRARYGR